MTYLFYISEKTNQYFSITFKMTYKMIRLYIFLGFLLGIKIIFSQNPPKSFASGSWLTNAGSLNQSGVQSMKGNLNQVTKKWEKQVGIRGCESEPLIVDLEGDNSSEIIVISYYLGDTLYVLNGIDGTIKWTFSDLTGLGQAGSECTPTVGDVNNDNILDIIIAKRNRTIYALNGFNGQIIWTSLMPGNGGGFDKNSLAFVDIENDGIPEIVCGQSSGRVSIINAYTGSILRQSVENLNGVVAGFAIADVNGDCIQDISFQYKGNGSAGLALIDGGSGSTIWKYSYNDTRYSSSKPSIGDINNDGVLDIIVGTATNSILAINALTGNLIWYYPAGGDVFNASPSYADIDMDGIIEVIVGGVDDKIYAFDGRNGNIKWTAKLDFDASVYSGTPKIGEFDPTSPGLEIIISTSYRPELNTVYMLSSQGDIIWKHKETNHTTEGIAVGDIDNDGCVEIVVNPDITENSIHTIYILDDINNSSGCGYLDIENTTPGEYSFYASKDNICVNECISFSASTENILSWNWTFENGSILNSKYESPSNICYNQSGNFDVILELETSCGPEIIKKEQYITVNDCDNANTIAQNIFIPNAIIFNGTNHLKLYSNNSFTNSKIELSIYNRFGKLIYIINGLQDQWDGMLNNTVVEVGMYSYILSIDNIVTTNGNITIIYN